MQSEHAILYDELVDVEDRDVVGLRWQTILAWRGWEEGNGGAVELLSGSVM